MTLSEFSAWRVRPASPVAFVAPTGMTPQRPGGAADAVFEPWAWASGALGSGTPGDPVPDGGALGEHSQSGKSSKSGKNGEGEGLGPSDDDGGSWADGHAEGYAQGYQAGLAEAQRLQAEQRTQQDAQDQALAAREAQAARAQAEAVVAPHLPWLEALQRALDQSDRSVAAAQQGGEAVRWLPEAAAVRLALMVGQQACMQALSLDARVVQAVVAQCVDALFGAPPSLEGSVDGLPGREPTAECPVVVTLHPEDRREWLRLEAAVRAAGDGARWRLWDPSALQVQDDAGMRRGAVRVHWQSQAWMSTPEDRWMQVQDDLAALWSRTLASQDDHDDHD